MKPKSFMLIAGEVSGDALGAELVRALRAASGDQTIGLTWDYQPLKSSLEPRFFGAGGPQMANAGVELALDLTSHAVTGLWEVLKNYRKFQRIFHRLLKLALERKPDAIICIDFSGFNRRFAHAIKARTKSGRNWFHDWRPRLIQYVSPQVWASRPGRARQMAEDYDLLLSIIPFEKAWYARHAPRLKVEFVGNSIVDRYGPASARQLSGDAQEAPCILLLPGSRPGELDRHLPVLLEALQKIKSALPRTQARVVFSSDSLRQRAEKLGLNDQVRPQVGGLAKALQECDLAIASTGTVTLECAYFGVPAVALYRTSWATWQVAKRIITVKYGAMPNLLADREIYPEFIQDRATAENIASAALDLLKNPNRRGQVQAELADITAKLGPPGAANRAAHLILEAIRVV